MNKIQKIIISSLITVLFSGCSFDNKTGIWSDGIDEKKRIAELEKSQKETIETIKVFTSRKPYKIELISKKNIILSKAKPSLSWPMSGSNLQNSIGNLYLSGTSNVFLKKKIGKDKFPLTQNYLSPLITKNFIIFSDDTGTVFKVNKSGKILWKKNIYKKLYKKIHKNLFLTIHDNKIYVSDNIGFLYSLSFDNGELLWFKNFGIPIKSNLKILDNKIYFLNQDNRIFCVDIKDGSKIWDIRTITSFIKSEKNLSLAISKKKELVILNSAGDLIKIKANNGRMLWSTNSIGTLAHDADFFQSSDIVIKNNEIFFSDSFNTFSYDLTNGYLNWKIRVGSKNTPIIDGENIFLITNNGFFLNINKNTGKVVWSTNILKILKKKKRNTQISGFVLGSGKIYAVSENGYLIVSSANTGKVESFKKIGDKISSSPIINDGSLYILTNKFKIFGFN